jgi:hypothetical protein
MAECCSERLSMSITCDEFSLGGYGGGMGGFGGGAGSFLGGGLGAYG